MCYTSRVEREGREMAPTSELLLHRLQELEQRVELLELEDNYRVMKEELERRKRRRRKVSSDVDTTHVEPTREHQ